MWRSFVAGYWLPTALNLLAVLWLHANLLAAPSDNPPLGIWLLAYLAGLIATPIIWRRINLGSVSPGIARGLYSGAVAGWMIGSPINVWQIWDFSHSFMAPGKMIWFYIMAPLMAALLFAIVTLAGAVLGLIAALLTLALHRHRNNEA